MLFHVGNLQYLATVLAFSIGKPFRKPFYTNIYFTLSIVLVSLLSIIIILVDVPFLMDFLAVIINMFCNIYNFLRSKTLKEMKDSEQKSWYLLLLMQRLRQDMRSLWFPHLLLWERNLHKINQKQKDFRPRPLINSIYISIKRTI